MKTLKIYNSEAQISDDPFSTIASVPKIYMNNKKLSLKWIKKEANMKDLLLPDKSPQLMLNNFINNPMHLIYN